MDRIRPLPRSNQISTEWGNQPLRRGKGYPLEDSGRVRAWGFKLAKLPVNQAIVPVQHGYFSCSLTSPLHVKLKIPFLTCSDFTRYAQCVKKQKQRVWFNGPAHHFIPKVVKTEVRHSDFSCMLLHALEIT